MRDYGKMKISLRSWLSGRKFYRALEALDMGLKLHGGTRKDGITPTFQHQIEIALYVKTLPISECMMEDAIIAALIHDAGEDCDTTLQEIGERFGPDVAKAFDLLTKKNSKMSKKEEDYFIEMAECVLAAIVKGVDQIHNIQTMQGVFDEEKQKSYIRRVYTKTFPMLKKARRKFPSHEEVFENLKYVLQNQIELIKHIHGWDKVPTN